MITCPCCTRVHTAPQWEAQPLVAFHGRIVARVFSGIVFRRCPCGLGIGVEHAQG